MNLPAVVSATEWQAAQEALLAKEKEATRARDALAAERRRLPMVRIDKDYAFDGPDGKTRLLNLFERRRQLLLYHFMFGPNQDAGCDGCSMFVDQIGHLAHLHARDTSLVYVSRAPLAKLEAFKTRMGWTFDWLSSAGGDFNYDFAVSFTPEEIKTGHQRYNFGTSGFGIEDAPGISVFYRDEAGNIFNTYSCFARGLDMMNAAYHYLDLTPLGRHEEGLPYPMDWLRLRDQYQPAPTEASCCHS